MMRWGSTPNPANGQPLDRCPRKPPGSWNARVIQNISSQRDHRSMNMPCVLGVPNNIRISILICIHQTSKAQPFLGDVIQRRNAGGVWGSTPSHVCQSFLWMQAGTHLPRCTELARGSGGRSSLASHTDSLNPYHADPSMPHAFIDCDPQVISSHPISNIWLHFRHLVCMSVCCIK